MTVVSMCLWGLAEPPAGRRVTDSEVCGDGHVPGALDEIPKPVVVALLHAGRGRHEDDHPPFPHAAQLLEDDGASADVTKTRAGKCKMSVRTARLRIGRVSSVESESGGGGCHAQQWEREAATTAVSSCAA